MTTLEKLTSGKIERKHQAGWPWKDKSTSQCSEPNANTIAVVFQKALGCSGGKMYRNRRRNPGYREFVEPGTVINKFSPYFNLNDVGYIHLMVNIQKILSTHTQELVSLIS